MGSSGRGSGIINLDKGTSIGQVSHVTDRRLGAGLQGPMGRLLLHGSFKNTIEGIRAAGVRLPRSGYPHVMDFGWVNSRIPEARVENVEPMGAYDVDAERGQMWVEDERALLSAYDESINRYDALEGSAYFTSHSMIYMLPSGYEPVNLLTMHFYTRSKTIHYKSSNLKLSSNSSVDSQKDYLQDKLDFIFANPVRDSILLIDGPIIAGDVYTRLMSHVQKFSEYGILPVFFVKNSDSNMVVDNYEELGGLYNSDMHWSHDTLKPGQRTCFFRYVDRNTSRNTKIFCYLKVMEVSPVRIEFFVDTFEKNHVSIEPIMDMIYYLTLVQGSRHNPQVRPIAIAEAYARETMKLFDFHRLMQESGLHPTMNQERFAW